MFVGEIFRRVLKEAIEGRDCGVGGEVGDCGAGGEVGDCQVVRVLDLCAAPGGKTTDLASSLRQICGDRFLLVANEVMGERASVLSENVARWGDPNVVVTKADPAAFAALEGFFDIILTDVPCSGEGMFRKDEEALEQWSVDNVALCRGRQRRILADVMPALREGGVLIYSTCTFNKYENDENVAWMCGELGCGPIAVEADAWREILRTEYGFSLVPGFVPGEGQYCAAVRKGENSGRLGVGSKSDDWSKSGDRLERGDGSNRCVNKAAKGGKKPAGGAGSDVSGWFSSEVEVSGRGELMVAVPKVIAPHVETVSGAVRTVRVGCTVGTVKGRDIVPSADLALSTMLAEGAFPRAEVDLRTALEFLHRDTITLPDAPKGYNILTYKGLPLGFVKNLGNRCNNLHPQSRRIRMEIR